MMARKFAHLILSFEKPGLISHIHPDGDAVGSQLALYGWLKHHGKDPMMFNDDPVPSNLSWLCFHNRIVVPEPGLMDQCDAFVLVDGNHPRRFGHMSEYLMNTDKPLFLIDHHLNPDPDLFMSMFWDPGACSTAMLVYRLIRATGLQAIDKHMAQALYSGIVTDTGSFRFDSVTAGTHRVVAEIIKRGNLRPHELHEKIFDGKTLGYYHLLASVFENIRVHCSNQLAVTYVTEEVMSRFDCRHEDLDGFVNYLLGIKGISVAVLLYEKDGRFKMSFRGKGVVDLNALAALFDGGGHFNAAGAWHPGPLDVVISDVKKVMQKYLQPEG